MPASAPAGAVVTLNGKNFGTTTGSVYFGDAAADLKSWSDTAIEAFVPLKDGHGQPLARGVDVAVLIQGTTPDVRQSSPSVSFTVAALGITKFDPAKPVVNTNVTITVFGFGRTGGTVFFSDQSATVTKWIDDQLVVTVPASDESGTSLAGKAVDVTVLPVTHAITTFPAFQLGL